MKKNLILVILLMFLISCASANIHKTLTLKVKGDEISYPMGITKIVAKNATIILERTISYNSIRSGND